MKLTSSETVVYSVCEEEHHRGVTIIMTPEAAKCLEEWETVIERIIRATFNSQ